MSIASRKARLAVELLEDRTLPSTYTFLNLPTLGGEFSQANAINNAGQIVGASDVSQGVTHPFLWQDGVMTDLGTFDGGAQGSALGINDAGQIAGYAWEGTGFNNSRAFRWEDGVLNNLGTLDALYRYSYGSGINSQGDLAGTTLDAHGNNVAFLDHAGVMSQIGQAGVFPFATDVNDFGQIVGYMEAPTDHAAIWQDGVLTDLGTLGGISSHAFAINNLGEVVGSAQLPGPNGNGPEHAFLWQNGTMIDLGTLGGPTSVAYGINDLGQIVGASTNSDGFAAAFLWQDGVMTNLTTLVSGPDQPITALGINDSGWIVGSTGLVAAHPLASGAGDGQAFVMIPQATPTVTVSDGGGVYSGSAYPASATATGQGGATVEGTFSFAYYPGDSVGGAASDTAPANAGVYTVVASFASSDPHYTDGQSDPLTFTISPATPQLVVHDAGGAYDGHAFAASATVTGVGDALVSGDFTFNYTDSQGNSTSTAPTNAGAYTVVVSFTSSDSNYADVQSNPLAFSITQATPTLTVSDAGGVFNGQPFPAIGAAIGVGGAPVSGTFTFTYQNDSSAMGGGSTTAPATPGVYTVVASFQSSDANYRDAASAPVKFSIVPPKGAKPTVIVVDAGGPYAGSPYTASATAAGVGGETVNGSFTFTYYVGAGTSGLGSAVAPKNAGTYTVVATFNSGDPTYANVRSKPATFFISPATTVTTLISSTNPSIAGRTATFLATITATSPGGPTPVGAVDFTVDQVTTRVKIVAGKAILKKAGLAAGKHLIRAHYVAGSNFKPSGANLRQVVQAVLKPPPPLAPKGTILTEAPTFRWNAVVGAEFFDLKLTDTTSGAQVFRNQHVVGTSLPTLAALVSGHHYQWVVRAQNSNGNVSPWSVTTSFTVATILPKPDTLTFKGSFAGTADGTLVVPQPDSTVLLAGYRNNLAGSLTFTIQGDGRLIDPYTGTMAGQGQDNAILLWQNTSGFPANFVSPMAFGTAPITSSLNQIHSAGTGSLVVDNVVVNFQFSFDGFVSATESNITGTLTVTILHRPSTGIGFEHDVTLQMGVVAQRQ